MRQQLEKEKQELDRRREEEELRRQRNAIVSQNSTSVPVPQKSSATHQVTIEVPPKVLEVQTALQNPTSFHVESIRKNQLHQYLSATQNLSSPLSTHSAPASNNVFGNRSNELGPPIIHASYKDPMLSEVSTVPSGYAPQHQSGSIINMKSESPTMMSTEHQPLTQNEQAILDDIMGLDKLENMAPLPYFESTAMMMPQTLPVSTNLLDVFGAAAGHQMFVPQISSSCPPEVKEEKMREACSFSINPTSSIDIKQFEKERIKKNNHNMSEEKYIL
jgi:hypothetical protein